MKMRMEINMTKVVEFEADDKVWEEQWDGNTDELASELMSVDSVAEGNRKNFHGITMLSLEDKIVHAWATRQSPWTNPSRGE